MNQVLTSAPIRSSKSSGDVRLKKRVLVADDQPVFRFGIVTMLNLEEGLICCGEADSAWTTRKLVANSKPDLLLMDIRLGTDDGLELVKSLKAQWPTLKIIVLSQGEEEIYAERALRAGAAGYLMKEEPTDQLIGAIYSVLSGECYVSRKLAMSIVQRSTRAAPNGVEDRSRSPEIQTLSDRELQVWRMIGQGMSTRQVSEKLNLSFKTIQGFRERIKRKLKIQTALDLVRRATAWVGQNK